MSTFLHSNKASARGLYISEMCTRLGLDAATAGQNDALSEPWRMPSNTSGCHGETCCPLRHRRLDRFPGVGDGPYRDFPCSTIDRWL